MICPEQIMTVGVSVSVPALAGTRPRRAQQP